MLSIVKMDFDSDIEVLDDKLIKTEEVDLEDSIIDDNDDYNALSNSLHSLELVPIVYTTKLDDMGVLRLNPSRIHPNQASDWILKESKPILRTYPGPPGKSRRNHKRFDKVKMFLQQIYKTRKVISNEKKDSPEDGNKIQIDLNSVKTEMLDEPIVEETSVLIDIQSVKNEVLEEQVIVKTETKDTCKYSDLLKLCKPCSVILTEPISIGPYWCSRVIHGGQVLKANRVHKIQNNRLNNSPQSVPNDDRPLITVSKPDLLVERKQINVNKETPVKQYKGPKKPNTSINVHPKNVVVGSDHNLGQIFSAHFGQRLMRNGVLEMFDKYSNEYYVYYTDKECNLVDYFKDTVDNVNLYNELHLQPYGRFKIENCCWVKKDECIQSLYPKICIYPNIRFMRQPHPCKPGACTCCCRKKENVKKPELVFSANGYNNKNNPENEVIEIMDIEDKINKNVISTYKPPNHGPNERLKKLLNAISWPTPDGIPNTLIGKALTYNKRPVRTTQANNRRLVTLQQTDQNTVIIFRNFEADVIEIYEIKANGVVESHLKTTCYTNTTQSDVKKLLKVPNSVNEAVCCWLKREEVITKLQNSKTILPSTARFIRTNHTCPSGECTCCCKPEKNKKIKLKNAMLPMRSLHWMSTLRAWKLTSEPECFIEQPENVPSVQTKSAPSVPASSMPKTKDTDDDCQITSVMTSPTLQPLPQPAVPGPAVPPSMFIPKAPDCDDLSEEVNALITSILDRFKDVRLTINGEGKVAAALNTPVNTLSTVELKVLANILSYAQSQVNLLGSKVNSGMSLSHIINLKLDNVQSNTPIDPNSVYKEFTKNVNITFPITPQAPAPPQVGNAPQTYTFFTNSMSVKNQYFNDAFSSFINTKMDPTPGTFAPVIENVYSLKEDEAAVATESPDEDSSFTTVWYRKPAAQSSVSTLSEESWKNTGKKRNDDIIREAVKSKKIRVLPPNKLSTSGESEVTSATSQTPSQPFVPVQGLSPGLVFLPNSNYSLSQAPSQTMVNCLPPVSASQPILIINPLQNSGGVISAPIGNNMIPNMANLAQLQPKIPLVVNSESNILTSTFVSTPITPSMAVEVTETQADVETNAIEDNLEMGNDPGIDNGTIIDDCAYDDIDDVEMKFSPENNEEEDCILGF